MIYPTVKECVETCSRTGVLKVEGLGNDEYVMKGAGFKPRYVRSLERPEYLKTPAWAVVFFSLLPIIILA
jgi:hypothetical protein